MASKSSACWHGAELFPGSTTFQESERGNAGPTCRFASFKAHQFRETVSFLTAAALALASEHVFVSTVACCLFVVVTPALYSRKQEAVLSESR